MNSTSYVGSQHFWVVLVSERAVNRGSWWS